MFVCFLKGTHMLLLYHRWDWSLLHNFLFLFFFFGCLMACGVPRPGIRSELPLSRVRQLWQCQIFNPLCRAGNLIYVLVLQRHCRPCCTTAGAFFFFFNGCTCSLWKFPGWGWKWTCKCRPLAQQCQVRAALVTSATACGNAGFLTH